jgi:hypothetical protein
MYATDTIHKSQLKPFTRHAGLIEELAKYTANAFAGDDQPVVPQGLVDEPQMAVWREYLAEASDIGIFASLQKRLVQLHFPIEAGISSTAAYREVTLKGASVKQSPLAGVLQLEAPEEIQAFMHQSLAGAIPVIVAPRRNDFISLIQALIYRNEPQIIPDSMGAAMVQGLNNWDRLERLRRLPFFSPEMLQNRTLYQDRFILLSKIPYSNVAAKDMKLAESEWLDASFRIRLEHECAHYFTLRQFGVMTNNMHDELIADYLGICTIKPIFDASWFMRFIGLENFPKLRADGRLRNYLGSPPLSPSAVEVLQVIIQQAASNLACFEEMEGPSPNQDDRRLRLFSLCKLSLPQLAGIDGVNDLNRFYHQLKVQL